jgi:hypothetical protein
VYAHYIICGLSLLPEYNFSQYLLHHNSPPFARDCTHSYLQFTSKGIDSRYILWDLALHGEIWWTISSPTLDLCSYLFPCLSATSSFKLPSLLICPCLGITTTGTTVHKAEQIGTCLGSPAPALTIHWLLWPFWGKIFSLLLPQCQHKTGKKLHSLVFTLFLFFSILLPGTEICTHTGFSLRISTYQTSILAPYHHSDTTN